MSNRYVWNRYNTNYEINDTGQTKTDEYTRYENWSSLHLYVDYYSNLQVDAYGNITGTKTSTDSNDMDGEIKVAYGRYFHAYIRVDGEDISIPGVPFFMKAARNTIAHRFSYSSSDNDEYYGIEVINYIPVVAEVVKGSASGTVSNAASSTYPQDGVSGNYWYTYQGSDNIDAAAVTYSSQEPRGGQPITINVSPSTGNEYGGTVRYTYQVQLAGGAWTTIATNSTATSCQYTIPAGTPTFAARVLASDTWGFSSSDYTTGATLTVINNEPPSAPDGITIGPVLGGEQTTITWGEATDSDGTIASYQLERQIDNGDTWTQIYTGLTRSYDDTINSEWATVNYRVRAVDDDGEAGPYTTGTMQTVNAGWLYFSGPPEDMGDKPAPFTFAFSIGSTTDGTTDINVSVLLDDENIYTGTPDAGEQVSLEIDTRLSYEGEHTIVVTFEKANLLGDQYVGTYNVPALEIPDGGHAVQFYDSDGVPVFPNTFARQVFAQRGNSAARLFDRVYSGTYTGTGTSGSSNPLKFRLSFRPKIVAIQAAGASAAAFGLWVQSAADPAAQAQGSMVVYNGSAQSLATVQWDDTNMILSIYAASAAQQLNVSGQLYGIFVGGAMA